jgi:hypothetical protein
VEAPLTGARGSYAALAAAAAMAALITAMALTGAPPGAQNLQRFEPNGIIAAPPSEILTVEIRLGEQRVAFRRQAGGAWAFDQSPPAEAPPELAAHLDAALRFMHVSTPARTLDPAEYRGTRFADFGLDPPACIVSLGAGDRAPTVADFGRLTPAETSQYVRLVGRPTLYLLPRHVGAEWRLTADLAQRAHAAAGIAHDGAAPASGRSAALLLPASIAQVWAVEIVAAGKLHRFERDRSGSWFLHVGQHSHGNGAPEHVADPAKAPIIAAAFAAFDETQIESVAAHRPSRGELDRFGLGRPPLIALLYPRDSSTPLARVEIGDMAADGFGRYAALAPGGDVVTIAAYEPQRLIELLGAVGATP